MKFRFIGTHNNGADSISYGGVTWHGTEPQDVTDPEWIRRLSGHPEFVTDKPQLDHDGNGVAGGSKTRRRRTKVAD